MAKARLSFRATGKLTSDYLDRLRVAARKFYSNGVSLYPTEDRFADLILDPSDTDQEMEEAFAYVTNLVPWPGHDHETLYFDIESHNAEKRWDMSLEDFFRVGQWAWGIDGETHITTDLAEFQAQLSKARYLVAHNGQSFDFSVMFGNDALPMAREQRLFDPMVFGNLANSAPFAFQDRNGQYHYMEVGGQSKVVPHTLKWLSLDNQAFQLGVPGKVGNLEDLARKYNPPRTKKADLDYGVIPVDDPDFVAYAKADIPALQGITRQLLKLKTLEKYDWREQLCAAINAQISRNGWVVDVPAAQERVETLDRLKEQTLTKLHEQYDFPLEGRAPWASSAGKQAILNALADAGVVPENIPTWPFGKTGPSLGGKVLLEHCKGTPAEELAEAVAMLAGQRPLAAQALENVHKDGRVHPDITALQRSGRMSTTKPSLGTWTSRGKGSEEKAYYLPDPGEILIAFDMSNADARTVAAMSGDKAFAGRFEEGADAHEITGRFMFGDELYDSDPAYYRNVKAKPAAHASNYGIGVNKLVRQLGITEEQATRFLEFMRTNYPNLIRWQNQVREFAKVHKFVVNNWGRKMPVDVGREYTQAPALLGQSSTRELLFDGLIALSDEILRMLKATIHDEVLFSFPPARVVDLASQVMEAFDVEWNEIKIPLQQGPQAHNWHEASH